jgi:hypothetical protein
MSRTGDNQTLLRTLASEGGRLKSSRLTYRDILAANAAGQRCWRWPPRCAPGPSGTLSPPTSCANFTTYGPEMTLRQAQLYSTMPARS